MRRSRDAIALKAWASTPSSSRPRTGIGSRNEPAATAAVASDSRRTERVIRYAIIAVAASASGDMTSLLSVIGHIEHIDKPLYEVVALLNGSA